MNRVISQQTHAEFMLQTLFYITRLVTEGDYGQITSLGLTEQQAQKIGTMPLDELHELALTMRSHMFKVAFDTRILDAAFDIHRRKTLERQEMLAMILAGASCANMAEFYGINKSAYTRMRSQMGLSINDIGRPPVPDENGQRLIWSVWLQHEDLDNHPRLLAVHSATQYKIRSIWQLLTEWRRNGLVPDALSLTELSTRLSRTDSEVKLAASIRENISDDNPQMSLH